jgi:hypothetical protein
MFCGSVCPDADRLTTLSSAGLSSSPMSQQSSVHDNMAMHGRAPSGTLASPAADDMRLPSPTPRRVSQSPFHGVGAQFPRPEASARPDGGTSLSPGYGVLRRLPSASELDMSDAMQGSIFGASSQTDQEPYDGEPSVAIEPLGSPIQRQPS